MVGGGLISGLKGVWRYNRGGSVVASKALQLFSIKIYHKLSSLCILRLLGPLHQGRTFRLTLEVNDYCQY